MGIIQKLARVGIIGKMLFFNRLPDIDISDRLSNITSPTLAIAGDSDPIVPSEQSLIIAKRVQKGKKCC